MLQGMKNNRRSWAALVAAAAVAWANGVASAESMPGSLRILTWNTHHGEGMDGRLDLPRLAEVIKKADPDIVLLQEVDDRTQRTGGVPQAEELGRLTGRHATFGKAMDFQGGGYGNAILTREAPVSHRVIPLPGKGEPRCALEVKLKLGGKDVLAVSTHWEVSAREARLEQAQKLADEYTGHEAMVILGGDFNDTPGSPPLEALKAPWVHEKKQGEPATIPAPAPKREIDFIFFKPAADQAWRVVRYEVIEEKVASDHRPVLLELAPQRP